MATAFGTPLQGAGLNPNGSQTLFLNGGAYQVEIAADNSESVTRYYSQASQRLAMRNPDGSIDYLLGDHLGSVSAVVNTAGEVISQSRYLPFGELLWSEGESPTDYSYTGQRSLSDLGLMDYNARFYDPLLGRFIQADRIVSDKYSISDWNLHSYVRNNPIRYYDPTGWKIACLIDAGDCAGTGTGKLKPKQILQVSTNDYFTTMAIYNYSVTHSDYSSYYDADLDDSEKAIVEGAIFAGTQENISRKYNISERIKLSFSGHGVDFIFAALVVSGIPDGAGNSIAPGNPSSWKFLDDDDFIEHYEKHGWQFGYKTDQEYLDGARNLFLGGDGVDSIYRNSDGATLYYRLETNEFGVLHSDGIIGTYYPLRNGLDQWKWIKRNMK